MTDYLKLNLGCGSNIKEGWVNIDLVPTPGAIRGDITCLEQFSGKVDYILLSHVVEHVPFSRIDSALGHWNEVLVDGGKIEIICPDIEADINNYLRTGNYYRLQIALWGGQRNGPYDNHLNGFTEKILRNKMENAGFEIVSVKKAVMRGMQIIGQKRVLDAGTI